MGNWVVTHLACDGFPKVFAGQGDLVVVTLACDRFRRAAHGALRGEVSGDWRVAIVKWACRKGTRLYRLLL